MGPPGGGGDARSTIIPLVSGERERGKEKTFKEDGFDMRL